MITATAVLNKPIAKTLTMLLCCSFLWGCASSKRLEVSGQFPVPVMEKAPVALGILLDQDLVRYTHTETVDKSGEWSVAIGPAQKDLFNQLGKGLFENHTFVEQLRIDAPFDGILRPIINEVQFALPSQTRSDYYEVWIRYEFELYDREGHLIGNWQLPAYGKASKKNYGSKANGVQAAALAACRDAMAFFSINFAREPVVVNWLAAGKPTRAAQPPAEQGNPSSPSTSGNPA